MTNNQKLQKGSFFKDAHGNTVLLQWPNIPLFGWMACKLISMLAPASSLKVGTEQIGSAFLFTWAFLEITQGVNYFRRALGIIIMTGLILSYLSRY